MSSGQVAQLLRVRKLHAERARNHLASAMADEEAARAEEIATEERTASAALDRETALSAMGRKTGPLRDIYRFAKLTDDHAAMLEAEEDDRRRAASDVEHCCQVVDALGNRARELQRVEEKTKELMTVMRGNEARRARRTMTRREEENASSRGM